MPDLPQRKRFYHHAPAWVREDALFFITVCCARQGKPQLTNPTTFAILIEALEHYIRRSDWWVESFLAMPDHWHALMVFPQRELMEKIVRDWKRFTARKAEIAWQDGFFEHRVRNQQSANEKWDYIRLNPIRKGLVTEPADWPYTWFPTDTAR